MTSCPGRFDPHVRIRLDGSLPFTTPLASCSRRFPKHARYYGDRSQDTDCHERPSCPFALILGEPIRNQQTEANAKRNAGSSDQHDLGDRKTSLCKSHVAKSRMNTGDVWGGMGLR